MELELVLPFERQLSLLDRSMGFMASFVEQQLSSEPYMGFRPS